MFNKENNHTRYQVNNISGNVHTLAFSNYNPSFDSNKLSLYNTSTCTNARHTIVRDPHILPLPIVYSIFNLQLEKMYLNKVWMSYHTLNAEHVPQILKIVFPFCKASERFQSITFAIFVNKGWVRRQPNYYISSLDPKLLHISNQIPKLDTINIPSFLLPKIQA